MLLVAVMTAACTFDFKTNTQITGAIVKKLHAKSVNVSDGAEANANFSGTRKEIKVDMGDSSSSDKSVMMNIAYHCADTAYRITIANKAKVPDLYRVSVKSGGLTSDFFNYKSAHLAKSDAIWRKVKPFMVDLIAKNYDKLTNQVADYLKPKMPPIISYLQKADSAGTGLISYNPWALNYIKDKLPNGKEIELMQAWMAVKINGGIYPMVVVVGLDDMVIYGVFINPQGN